MTWWISKRGRKRKSSYIPGLDGCCLSGAAPNEAEPRAQCVPRRSLGTRGSIALQGYAHGGFDAVGFLGFHLEMPPDERAGQRLDAENDFAVLKDADSARRLAHGHGN